MKISSFLKLVEIQTKVASVIPYLLGTAFSIYAFREFNWINAIILFSSMIIFDMTTTAINNYMDFKKAVKKDGFGYETHNAIVKDKLNLKVVKLIILLMLLISITLGIILVKRTDFTVLIIGVICFGIGILYSYGPIPISRTPFGEILSGITMGGAITFLATYVHNFDNLLIKMELTNSNLVLNINVKIIMLILFISIPAIVGISNIMLANNICDIEDDIVNKRYTLPIYIGKENALRLFKILYHIGYITIIIGILIKVLPIISILTLFTYKFVKNNILEFYKKQTKKDTFVFSVKNFVVINVVYVITIFLGILI